MSRPLGSSVVVPSPRLVGTGFVLLVLPGTSVPVFGLTLIRSTQGTSKTPDPLRLTFRSRWKRGSSLELSLLGCPMVRSKTFVRVIVCFPSLSRLEGNRKQIGWKTDPWSGPPRLNHNPEELGLVDFSVCLRTSSVGEQLRLSDIFLTRVG